jgi:hypothetical protein
MEDYLEFLRQFNNWDGKVLQGGYTRVNCLDLIFYWQYTR